MTQEDPKVEAQGTQGAVVNIPQQDIPRTWTFPGAEASSGAVSKQGDGSETSLTEEAKRVRDANPKISKIIEGLEKSKLVHGEGDRLVLILAQNGCVESRGLSADAMRRLVGRFLDVINKSIPQQATSADASLAGQMITVIEELKTDPGVARENTQVDLAIACAIACGDIETAIDFIRKSERVSPKGSPPMTTFIRNFAPQAGDSNLQRVYHSYPPEIRTRVDAVLSSLQKDEVLSSEGVVQKVRTEAEGRLRGGIVELGKAWYDAQSVVDVGSREKALQRPALKTLVESSISGTKPISKEDLENTLRERSKRVAEAEVANKIASELAMRLHPNLHPDSIVATIQRQGAKSVEKALAQLSPTNAFNEVYPSKLTPTGQEGSAKIDFAQFPMPDSDQSLRYLNNPNSITIVQFIQFLNNPQEYVTRVDTAIRVRREEMKGKKGVTDTTRTLLSSRNEMHQTLFSALEYMRAVTSDPEASKIVSREFGLGTTLSQDSIRSAESYLNQRKALDDNVGTRLARDTKKFEGDVTQAQIMVSEVEAHEYPRYLAEGSETLKTVISEMIAETEREQNELEATRLAGAREARRDDITRQQGRMKEAERRAAELERTLEVVENEERTVAQSIAVKNKGLFGKIVYSISEITKGGSSDASRLNTLRANIAVTQGEIDTARKTILEAQRELAKIEEEIKVAPTPRRLGGNPRQQQPATDPKIRLDRLTSLQ